VLKQNHVETAMSCLADFKFAWERRPLLGNGGGLGIAASIRMQAGFGRIRTVRWLHDERVDSVSAGDGLQHGTCFDAKQSRYVVPVSTSPPAGHSVQ
jgi:hypothetical protein